MKDVEIKAAAGVRNDVSPERLTKNDLAAGVNIDIDSTGKISRRKGVRQVSAGTDVHSLACVGDAAYFVDGTTLYSLNASYAKVALRSNLAVGRRMAFLDVNGAAYFSNGVDSGVTTSSKARQLGISVPYAPRADVISGNLLAGAYGVTMTYVRNDGVESGAPGCVFVDVPGSGGLVLTLPVSTDPNVTTKQVYITERDGEEPYLAMVLDNSVGRANYVDDGPRTLICNTQFKSSMPAGEVLGLYNGRLFVGVGNTLFFSEPYSFELCDMRSNYIPFMERITIVAPVSDGLFVGTETETVFLKGGDPSDFELMQVSTFGSVFGTLALVDAEAVTDEGVPGSRSLKGKTPMWATTNGVCAGSDGGVFTELTTKRYVLPAVAGGASAYRHQPGLAQFLTTFY